MRGLPSVVGCSGGDPASDRMPFVCFSRLRLIIVTPVVAGGARLASLNSCSRATATDVNVFKRNTDALVIVLSMIICCGVAAAVSAHPNSILFERLTTTDGLSQNTVTSILQDSRGFLWFGTEGGLNRFDGYEFKVFKPVPGDPKSLSGTQVWSLFEDRNGVLWVGTYDGLNRFDRVTETFERFAHDDEDRWSLSDDSVRTILEDSRGDLWIGTKNGLNRRVIDPSGATRFETFGHDPLDPTSLGHPHVRCLLEDGQGRLWVATRGGLDLFDPETQAFTHYLRNERNPDNPGGDGVLVLAAATDGKLWVGTYNGGLDRFDTATGAFEHVPLNGDGSSGPDSILSIREDHDGKLWIGTFGGGLVVLDSHDFSSRRVGGDRMGNETPGDDIVWSITRDRTGIMWVGTSLGIAKHDPARQRFSLWRAEDSSADLDYVRAIVTDATGRIWVGARGGLSILNRNTGSLEPAVIDGEPVVEGHVRALLEDREGELWIGTDQGLVRLDSDQSTIEDPVDGIAGAAEFRHRMVTCLLEDHRGDLWIGTRTAGLFRFRRGSGDSESNGRFDRLETFRAQVGDTSVFEDLFVRCLFEDEDGRLWVGFNRMGLAVVDSSRREARHFPPQGERSEGLNSGSVTSILQGREGAVWVSTYGGGFNRLDPTSGSFRRFTEADGLADNVVYGILEDSSGRLWMSTNNGVARFDPTAGAGERFRSFGVRDGLQGNEFNSGAYYMGPEGEMFFGGVNGLNSFHPEKMFDDPTAPAVVLTAFEVFNRSVGPGDLVNGRRILDCSIGECTDLMLRWSENVFAFRFSGLHFSNPQANTYAFRLTGFDRDWNEVGTRRIATYSQVPPGTYVFQVRAANPDGCWSDVGTAISLQIKPPYWMTWWFRAGVLAGIAFLVAVLYRVRTSRLRKRARALEELNLRLERQMSATRQAEQAQNHLLEQVREMHDDLEQAYDATLEGWAKALELRDEDTEGHTRRVAEMTVKLASRLGLSEERVEQIRRGAVLHDIGKMGIPDDLLRKKEELTPEDWTEIRKHPEYARSLLEPISFLREAAVIPYAHHERWDGSGYPRGLEGCEIPFEARIFAVVDVWDALRSDRPYRPGWSEERVRRHIEDGSGSMFDPDVVHAFLQMIDEQESNLSDSVADPA